MASTQLNSDGATDRIITAAELVRLKKGEALVIGGGEYSSSGQTGLHGQLIAEWLESWKPFDSPIHVLGYSSNTKDEADQTKVLAEKNGWKKIILVTSANHMRRAEALFKKTGLEVVSVGSDFEGLSSLEADFRIYSIVPGSGGFDKLGYYLHEQVGWLYYKAAGLDLGQALTYVKMYDSPIYPVLSCWERQVTPCPTLKLIWDELELVPPGRISGVSGGRRLYGRTCRRSSRDPLSHPGSVAAMRAYRRRTATCICNQSPPFFPG